MLCEAVMLLASRLRSTREAEGVGFEPTVGFPTLDFESSALNRTQPPFRDGKRTSNAERPTSNVQRKYDADDPVCEEAVVGYKLIALLVLALRVPPRAVPALGREDCLVHEGKNVTIFRLPSLSGLLHLVYPHGQPRYYLLLTGIHRFLAPLFTTIPNLFRT